MTHLKCTDLYELLVGVLSHFQFPLSVSFMNASLRSIIKLSTLIDEQFLKNNRETFKLKVIGSDLKIMLRDKGSHSKGIVSIDENITALRSVIDKDGRKVLMLREALKKESRQDMLFDEFISKYNSKKRAINIAFILRNSHALQVFPQNEQTYVKFVMDGDLTAEVDDEEIYSLLNVNSFENLVLRCLQSLLCCFFKPMELGKLQACCMYGNIAVDSGFLSRYSYIFKCEMTDSIRLVELWADYRSKDLSIDVEENLNADTDVVKNPKQDILRHSNFEDNVDSVSRSNSLEIGMESVPDSIGTEVSTFIEQKRSMVLVGNGVAPLFVDVGKDLDNGSRLDLLKRMKKEICAEIVINGSNFLDKT